MNQFMALIWVGTGAVLLGLAVALVAWRREPVHARVLPAVVTIGSFLVCSFWLVVPPVHALSITIDSARPGEVTCDSALAALDETSFVRTDVGREFSLANGACQAAAWERIASLGSVEIGLALLVGAGATLLRRRDPASERDKQAVSN